MNPTRWRQIAELFLFLTACYSSERQSYTKLLHTEAEEEESQNSQYVPITAVCTQTEPLGEPKEKEVLYFGKNIYALGISYCSMQEPLEI